MRTRAISSIALVLCAILICTGCVNHHPSSSQTSSPTTDRARTTIGFASEAKLQEHYEKHGSEFGSITIEEYLRQAQTMRDRPVGGDLLEFTRADGVITRYDRDSGAFLAFDADGTIRTYFKPNAGERYFLRQRDRG